MKGFSLLEVLISLFILSVGLLALAKLQVAAMINIHEAYLQTLASVRLRSITAIIKTLPQDQLAGEIQHWNAVNRERFPQGQSSVSVSGFHYRVLLSWYARAYGIDQNKRQKLQLEIIRARD